MLALFTTRYRMPFRLDDVVLMLWAKTHTLADAFDPIRGQMINSFRPMFAVTAYALTHLAGWNHRFWWHLTLDLSLLIGIAFIGLTARYITGRWYALPIAVLLYFIAFLPILNIFFWYADLTYGLELAFSGMVWYFGLRGLYEANTRYWFLAMALGVLAVLSKEPAFVLVHVVLLGSFLLERNQIREKWNNRTALQKRAAIISYVLLLGVSFWVAFVSPTRSNRFFAISAPNLGYFIRDRIAYYSAIYLSITARLLLFTPIVYVFVRNLFRVPRAMSNGLRFALTSIAAILLALLFFQNILIAIPLTLFIFVALSVTNHSDRPVVRRLLPFLACLLIAVPALLLTIQLVKTQLTEVALLTVVLSSWAWATWGEDLFAFLKSLPSVMRTVVLATAGAAGIILLIAIAPRVAHEERLLREVRDVRENANNAVAWAATNLPPHSLLVVTEYPLYGIDGAGALTPLSDETKLADQYTFDGGFVFDALEDLARPDFRRTYLSDSLMLPRVLAAMRTRPHSYVLLQSKLDYDRFHGAAGDAPLLTPGDTLVAEFARAPYPSQIWEIR